MIVLALKATIGEANSRANIKQFANAKRDWFRRYVKLEYGVSSHDTFGHVFTRLDTGQFLARHARLGRSGRGNIAWSGDRHRLQDATRLVRSGGRAFTLAHHHCLCDLVTIVPAADVSRKEMQRETGSASALATAGTCRGHGHTRRDVLPDRNGLGDCRWRRRLPADRQGEPRDAASQVARDVCRLRRAKLSSPGTSQAHVPRMFARPQGASYLLHDQAAQRQLLRAVAKPGVVGDGLLRVSVRRQAAVRNVFLYQAVIRPESSTWLG